MDFIIVNICLSVMNLNIKIINKLSDVEHENEDAKDDIYYDVGDQIHQIVGE